jgi:hypothetical protein
MVAAFKFAGVYIIPFFELIPVLVGILSYKYLNKPLKIIFYFTILYVVMDSLNSVMAVVFHQQSKPYTDTFAILELPFISAFYMQVLGKKWKAPIIILLVVYYLLWIADLWFIEPDSPMNVYPLALQSILIMLYAIAYMNQQTQTNIDEQWSANPVNWISSGFLLYCASCVLLTLFYNQMLEKHIDLTLFIILWEINTLAAVIQVILISIGIYKCRQSQIISL